MQHTHQTPGFFVAGGNDSQYLGGPLLNQSPEALVAFVHFVAEGGRLGLHVGGTVTIMTPKGPQSVPVEGIFYDYATDGGKMVMERTFYRQLWNDDRVTVFALYLAPGVDSEQVRQSVKDSLRKIGADGDR